MLYKTEYYLLQQFIQVNDCKQYLLARVVTFFISVMRPEHNG